jgi:ABC-type Fe3+-siderophore transport system permease subunit
MSNPVSRVTTGMLGVVFLAASVAGAFYLLFMLALTEPPNPYEPNGDPCCGHPDTWHDVWVGVGITVGFAAVLGAIVAGSIAFLMHSVRARWPRTRTILLISPALAVLAAVVVAMALRDGRDDVTVPPGCDRADLGHCGVPKPDY